jgi:hypothetical protein
MVKKVRIEKWELYYIALCMVLFGFWMGYILGGSSSWAAKPDARDAIIPNGAVIISSLAIMFLLVKVILYYYRKLKLTKKKQDSKN